MPQIIHSIDEISCNVARDIIFAVFAENEPEAQQSRSIIVEWLESNDISYEPCIAIASAELIDASYTGDIYIDLEMNESDPKYNDFLKFMETNSGESKHASTQLMWLDHDYALEVQQKKQACRENL